MKWCQSKVYSTKLIKTMTITGQGENAEIVHLACSYSEWKQFLIKKNVPVDMK